MVVSPRGDTDDLSGYELIGGTGAISTLEIDDDWEEPNRVPFGFRAPEVIEVPEDLPETPSEAWGRWLP